MSKSLPIFIIVLNALLFLVSCSDHKECPDCIGCGKDMMYGGMITEKEIVEVKSTEAIVDTVSIDKDFAENKVKIEKIYGEQWDFCRCVVANDSLDKVVKSGAEMDDNFMKVFEEVDVKCKAFLVMSPNKTPKERSAHENKIKKCLKNAL